MDFLRIEEYNNHYDQQDREDTESQKLIQSIVDEFGCSWGEAIDIDNQRHQKELDEKLKERYAI